mmetsp:Transcript_37836/g.36264  ORF Transcript_37836/g.36264 Transcript_37836/m.36264 type:complete len:89 (+) Transcript_37836:951-1217(+)
MKRQMEKLTMYNVDIASDPARAIKLISDPILKLQNIKVEDFEEQLKANMAQKKDLQDDIIVAKNNIFEDQTKQINLEREKEEIKEKLG